MKVFAAIVAVLAVFSAPGNAVNLAEKATELGLTDLVSNLQTAGLADAVANIAAGTVFGPTNAAFAALPQNIKDAIAANATVLSQVLQYHVIASKVMSNQLSNDQLAASLDGRNIRINIYGQVITATGAVVSNADNEADNGVIHIVDSVMLPPDFTVTNYVVNNADFSTLLTAVQTANLGATLDGVGPFTVFAPNNAAFAKIPEADLNALLADIPKLTKVLQYHVVSGTVYSVGLSNGQEVATLSGDKLMVDISGNTVKINDATVIAANVNVLNGVIHAVDTVLMPPEAPTPTPTPIGAATTIQVGLFSTLLISLLALLM